MIPKNLGHIFLLGMGVSGMSLALYLTKHKVLNSCWDDDHLIRAKAKKKKLNVEKITLKSIARTKILVLSPGINHEQEKPHKAVILAKELKIKIVTDLEFFKILDFKNFLIGITGTNGKSTTTHFIHKVISHDNYIKAQMCGNIGVPFTDLDIKKETRLIVEASSYQLSKIDKLKFDYAFLLNISNDHIEWHGGIKNYINSKKQIFKNQDKNCYAIISIDDEYSRKIAYNFEKSFQAKLIKISYKKNENADIYLSREKHQTKIFNKISNKSFSISEKKIKFTKGVHNFQNLLAAYVASFLLKQKQNKFLESIEKIDNLEHRMEFLGNINHIFFYNDSKSTNVNSAITALKSLQNVFWIVGGREKKGGLYGVEKNLKNIIKAFSYGESGIKIKNHLEKNSISCFNSLKLEECFEKAFSDAIKLKKKINILLSPACASFDQFKNFEMRGKFFKNLVENKIRIYNGL